MPKAGEMRSDYIVQFVSPFKDPRLEEVDLEDHLYLVTMTQEQADMMRDSMQRLLDHGFIVEGFSITLAEMSRITSMDLRRRLTYVKQQGMA
jgi:hypothetical protein